MASRTFVEKLRSGPNGAWGAAAVMQYPTLDRLSQVAQPVLVLRPKDDLWEATQRARAALPKARFVDIADQGFGLLEVAPERVVAEVRPFLAG
jgi:pimeloyl-ACP methyl ester carboxylesterase